jgi:NitT/TauT family transport system substrate-binding protein
MIKELNIGAWVNDQYVRQAFKEKGLDYDKQLASFDTYNVTGTDPICNAPVNDPKKTGEIWIQGGDIVPFSSPVCTLLGVKKYGAEGKKFNAVYLVDHQLGIKVFADAAFYSVGGQTRRSGCGAVPAQEGRGSLCRQERCQAGDLCRGARRDQCRAIGWTDG